MCIRRNLGKIALKLGIRVWVVQRPEGDLQPPNHRWLLSTSHPATSVDAAPGGHGGRITIPYTCNTFNSLAFTNVWDCSTMTIASEKTVVSRRKLGQYCWVDLANAISTMLGTVSRHHVVASRAHKSPPSMTGRSCTRSLLNLMHGGPRVASTARFCWC